ncbi:MAG: hypothetical protein ACOCV8_05065, partial [Spirochaetota bacterium]
LLKNINAKYILISYSIDGIINFDDMLDILIEKGSLDIITSPYVKYPGGKQSLKRETNNIEFVLIVNTEKKGKKSDKTKVYSKLIGEKIPLYYRRSVSVDFLKTCGFSLYSDNDFIKSYRKEYIDIRKSKSKHNNNSYIIELDILNDYSFYENGNTIRYKNNLNKNISIKKLPLNIKEQLLNDLKTSCDLTKEDELNMILSIIKKNMLNGYYDVVYKYLPRIPYLLKKFNNRKAYKSSLNMIYKITKTFKQTGIHKLETKKVINTMKKLNKIVSTKLAHKSPIENINPLKDNIRKEYYKSIANKYELTI